ncbi:stalk domain-containing protein [Paenibacillus sp.]|uniref:stalk domain-containing protein n=1 Tax=Paenibacillus sp. TaxID=58172 RepID=UPI002D56B058|nr:stalk domain-containing protein [Paenibacillus sp.]HZG87378.1 stalk domain-containing protein [Paenibacillus sp.]
MGERASFPRWGKPIFIGAVAGSLLIGTAVVPGIGPFAPAAYAAEHQLVMQQESIVTAGVKLRTYRWTRTKNTQPVSTDVQVLIADLHNPNVKLDVMTGVDGQFTKKANVLDMARATGAVAGVNGDYFDMQAQEPSTLGPQVAGNALMATPTVGLEGMYAFGITKQNQPIIETFTSAGTVAAVNGQTYPLTGLNRVVGTIGNAIYMYDAAWGSATRAKDATPHTEVLVVNGIVQNIVAGGRIPGTVPANGYILSAGGKGAEFLAANVKVGDALLAKTSLVPVNPNLKYTENDFKMLIGGHTILLIDGAPAAFTRDVKGISGSGNTARTAVGFSKDGRYVYMVTAEHADDSVGPTLPDFQQLLVDLGLWRAVNLDGGGSTTIVSRPLGEFEAQLVNTPKDGSQRRVVNGLGIFTTALPAALKDFIVDGPKTLWKGQTASYSAKAYDVNYNPLDPAKLAVPVQFKARGTNLLLDSAAGSFTAAAGGTDTVVAYSGTIAEDYAVEIIDRTLVQKLEVVPSKAPGAWVAGDAIRLEVKATLTDGRTGTIPAGIVRWQAFGALGAIQQDTLTFAGFAEGVDEAMLVGRFDGFSTPLSIPVPAEKPLTDFSTVPWSISAEKYPAQAIASVALAGTEDDTQLHLAYDFRAGDGATDLAAYAAFNGTAGIPLPDGPIALELDVFGDGQGGWLRAEFTDADGNVQRATIAEKVDWTGWRTVSVDVTPYRAVSLKRLYVVSKAAIQGELVFDDLNLLYPSKTGGGTSVALTVGKKDVVVGGQPQQLDVAPLIDRERTFVPVRFVVDALGGHVDWDAADKKVTIRKGGHFVELWIGQTEMIADGARIGSDVSPMLRGGRTMLPLRFVSEQLGLNVVWDPATRGITIQ